MILLRFLFKVSDGSNHEITIWTYIFCLSIFLFRMPQLKQQVEKAEQISIAATDKLKKEKEKLETYKFDMANLKALSELNETMAQISDITTELDIDSARSQFEEAQNSIEKRYLWENAKAELAENKTEQIQIDLDRRSLDEEINRRFAKLKK